MNYIHHNQRTKLITVLGIWLCLRLWKQIERRSRVPRIPFGPTGEEYVQSLIHGADYCFQAAVRMEKSVFLKLSGHMRDSEMMKNRCLLSIEGQLILYIHLAAFILPNRQLQERFQMCGWTIGSICYTVNNALAAQSTHWIQQPTPNYRNPKLDNDPQFSAFTDALGALDGTHVPLHLPSDLHDNYRNCKGTLSHNVLACCDFDLNFVYVLAGWEGKAHDAAVLADAITTHGFIVPKDRFYLGDGGYANRWPVIAPFCRVRYHLNEWSRGNNGPTNEQELYNLRHASLRNVVERVFGVVKKRFPGIKYGIAYSVGFQVKFVYAIFALHNFINGHRTDKDQLYRLAQNEYLAGLGEDTDHLGQPIDSDNHHIPNNFSTTKRQTIANKIWDHYQTHMAGQGRVGRGRGRPRGITSRQISQTL